MKFKAIYCRALLLHTVRKYAVNSTDNIDCAVFLLELSLLTYKKGYEEEKAITKNIYT